MNNSFVFRNGNYLGLLVANTILGSAMPMLIILGGLAGLELAPSMALATLPASLQMMAGLLTAGPFSLFMGRYGRKNGFYLGVGCAIVGGLVAVRAMKTESFILLCIGHMAIGAALACYQYFRFAAAETVSTKWKPIAISLMLTSGLIAAFVGPQIFILSRESLSPTPLAGAYAALVALSLAGLVPLALTRLPYTAPVAKPLRGSRFFSRDALKKRSVRLAVGLAAVTQGIMVFLMIPTPLAMIGHGHGEALAGDVIRWHVVAMFAPSFFTGFLIKRFGVLTIATVGLVLLIVSSVIALSGLSRAHFYISLVTLGVGWNFGFIAATTMLADAVSDVEKAAVQGANDTVIALVSTCSAFAAGGLVAGAGWVVLATAALVILVLSLAAFLVEARRVA